MYNLRVEVVDDKGKTGQATCLVNYATSSGTYSLHQNFKNEGIVPQDWYVSNGSTKRVGGGLPYTDGPRILRFTNSSKAFEYGLLVLNATSKEKSAWAKFGDKSGRSYLTLHAGQYALKYKLCNWNQPQFKPVTVAIEDTNGQELASQTYTPTVNIGGKTSNKFTGVNQQTLEFEVPETGDYVVVFYAGADKNSDFVLGTVSIQAVKFTTSGIEDVNDLRMKEGDSENQSSGCFDLSGRRLSEENLKPGLYIIGGRKVVVK